MQAEWSPFFVAHIFGRHLCKSPQLGDAFEAQGVDGAQLATLDEARLVRIMEGDCGKSLGTHGVCAKQFCTSIPVCPMGDLIPCTCADIQILQRALVALIRIAHGRTILRFIYAMLAYLRYSPGTSGPDPFGLEIITW